VSQPIQPEVAAEMKDIGRIIGNALPKGFVFALLVCDLGEGGFMNYMSNANHSDMIKAMRELLGNLERERT
jgi:hypothetical protein